MKDYRDLNSSELILHVITSGVRKAKRIELSINLLRSNYYVQVDKIVFRWRINHREQKLQSRSMQFVSPIFTNLSPLLSFYNYFISYFPAIGLGARTIFFQIPRRFSVCPLRSRLTHTRWLISVSGIHDNGLERYGDNFPCRASFAFLCAFL